jgi:hypothetical protein
LVFSPDPAQHLADLPEGGVGGHGLHEQRHEGLLGPAGGLLDAAQEGGDPLPIPAGPQRLQAGPLRLLDGRVHFQPLQLRALLLDLEGVHAHDDLLSGLDGLLGPVG